ncbi:MAG: hypothetical protein MR799_06095 [Lachnospiraceae bacterium]|nr:hypothetical protein [Lachnospiraceae bacterium]
MKDLGLRAKLARITGNNSGMAVVEVVLLIVVLIALVAIFRTQALALVNKIWTSIKDGASGITGMGMFIY